MNIKDFIAPIAKTGIALLIAYFVIQFIIGDIATKTFVLWVIAFVVVFLVAAAIHEICRR